MDHTLAVLTSFPPEPEAIASSKQYDVYIRSYIKALGGLAESSRAAILSNASQTLQVLHPAHNSIGYLAVLDILVCAPAADRNLEQEELLDAVLDFLLEFDPYQIRYTGSSFLALVDKVGTGRLFSPRTAVTLIAGAMSRLDPSLSVFTSTHLLLAKLAFDTNETGPALPVIRPDLAALYPNMGGPKDPRPLCHKSLEPTSYLSSLTNPLTAASVLEYGLLCGLIYISHRDWALAQSALERVITHPAKDKNVSKIMSEAYKKWLLVGLLNEGCAPTLPTYTAPATKNSYTALAPKYNSLATQFSAPDAAQIKTDVETNAQVWEDDGNTSLVAEVVGAYQKWQIINLKRVHRNVPISKIQSATRSAETGEPLKDIETTTELVRGMIESGMLKGELEVGGSGEESYLSFQSDEASMTETDFARQIAESHQRIETLGKKYRLTNERLSASKEYVRHLARRLDKEDGDGGVQQFDSQIEDEDLMTGIVAHS